MNFLQALGDNALTRLQPLLNNPLVACPLTHFDSANTYLVVLVHNCNLVAALKFSDRALRDEKSARSHIGRSSDSGVPTRAENVFVVGESPSYSNGAGGLINFAV